MMSREKRTKKQTEERKKERNIEEKEKLFGSTFLQRRKTNRKNFQKEFTLNQFFIPKL